MLTPPRLPKWAGWPGAGFHGFGECGSGFSFPIYQVRWTRHKSLCLPPGPVKPNAQNLPAGGVLREWIYIVAAAAADGTIGGGGRRGEVWRWLWCWCICAFAQTPCFDIVQVIVLWLERCVYVRVSIANEPAFKEGFLLLVGLVCSTLQMIRCVWWCYVCYGCLVLVSDVLLPIMITVKPVCHLCPPEKCVSIGGTISEAQNIPTQLPIYSFASAWPNHHPLAFNSSTSTEMKYERWNANEDYGRAR